MLDRKYVLNNLDLIEQNMVDRQSKPVDLQLFAELESEYRGKEQRLQQLRESANAIAQQRSPEAIERGRRLRDEERTLREEVARLRERSDALLRVIPNLTHPDVPIGGEEDSRGIAFGPVNPPMFDFLPKDHVDLATDLGILDLAAGSRVAGAGFYFLQGEAVLLEFALQQLALERLIAAGVLPADRARAGQRRDHDGCGLRTARRREQFLPP